MRLAYPIDLSPEEQDELLQTRAAIKRWWREFETRASDLVALFKRQREWDLPQWMNEWLAPIAPNLFWEYGRGLMGGHRLVITCESYRHLRPLVSEILSFAPQIEGWEFYPFRLPEDVESASMSVDARGGSTLEEMRFQIELNDYQMIDVECLVEEGFPADKQSATGFVGLESLLGEETLSRWVGGISHQKLDRFPPHCLKATELLGAVRNLMNDQRSSLPDKTWISLANETEWSLFELEPAESPEDYAFRDDQYTQVSGYTKLHSCLLNRMSFDSERFSKLGEVFCFLKIDGSEGLPDWGFADRGEIEEALDSALNPAGLGAVIGGGMGYRYTYVDIALTDVVRAVPIIREELLKGGVSTRSWLLFMDEDLADEWIGITPTTPPPPRIAVS